MLNVPRLSLQQLSDQVVGDRMVGTGKLSDEALGIRMLRHRDRSETNASCPPFGPFVECCRRPVRQDHTGGCQDGARFGFGEAQVSRAYLCKFAGKPELM